MGVECRDVVSYWTEAAIDISMGQMPIKDVTDQVFNRAKATTFNSIQIGIEISVRNRDQHEVYDEFDGRKALYNHYVIDRIQLMVDELNQTGVDIAPDEVAKLVSERATSIFEEKYPRQ